MIVSILQENLLKALTRTSRILTSKAPLPVLQNALLVATSGQLRVTTTNLETTERVVVGAKTDKEGGLCVPARLLTELVMTLPVETVHLALKEGSLVVESTGVSATIPGMPASEFPPTSLPEKGRGGDLAKRELVAAASRVLFAAATDEGRPILTGVKVQKTDSGILLVATDGYRLSVQRVNLALAQALNLIIPARALSEVVKVADEEKEAETLSFFHSEEGQLVFRIGDTDLVTRVIDGEYPNYEKIIPRAHTTRARLDRGALLRAVRSAAIFARDNANIVRMAIDKGKLVVSAATAQAGENNVEVDAQVEGEGGEIAFNSRFLLEFLANFTESELLFEMTGSLNPGLFRPVKDDSFFHVIMPIRTASG